MRSRTAVLTALAIMTGTLVAAGPAAQAEDLAGVTSEPTSAGQEEFLGNPIEGRILSQEQSQGHDADGNPQEYLVTAGNDVTPGMFQVTDIRSGEVVFRERLPAGANSWASTFSEADGTVYFGMTEGDFYSWTPGDDAVTVLPRPPYEGEGIWRLHAAADGTIYGGTYPGGLLFGYNPQSQEFTSHGQAVPGETYARSIVSDDDSVYVGTQPRARLTRMDIATGEFHPIELPEEYRDQGTVYDMTRAGGYLFIRVEPVNDLLVYDVGTGEFVDVVKGITGRAISGIDPSGRYVYFRIAAEGIVQYDLDTHTYSRTGWRPNAFPGSFAWVDLQDPDMPGLSLVMTYYYGRIYTRNFSTGQGGYIGETDLEGAPNLLQTIATGPDERIYAGAFLSPPGMAVFDPADDSMDLLTGAGQVEGFGVVGDRLLFGRYPGARLYDYDTAQPWSFGTNPVDGLAIDDDQDRPVAFAEFGDRVAVGTVPKSGRLGGALTWWHPATGAVETHRDLVADQSIVSLAASSGLIVAGTSTYGGYGIDPVASDARIVVVDPATSEVRHSSVPKPGATSVSALTVDDDGLVWAVADGTLFQYDPLEDRIVRSAALFPATDTRYGGDRGLVLTDHSAFVTSSGRLWQVDRRTWTATELAADGVHHLTADADGRLYFTRGAGLYRFTPTDEEPVCDRTISGRHDGPLAVADGLVCAVDADVRGPVSVTSGASLVVTGGTVSGPIVADAAGALVLDDAEVRGPVTVTAATGQVAVVGTEITGPLALRSNRGGTTLGGATVHGPVTCTGNDPAVVNGGLPNRFEGPVSGQCADLG